MTISETLHDAAHDADVPTLDLDDIHRRAAGRRRRRGRASVAAGVVAVAALAGLAGVAANGDDRPREAAFGTVVSGGGDGQASSRDGDGEGQASSSTDPEGATTVPATEPGTTEGPPSTEAPTPGASEPAPSTTPPAPLLPTTVALHGTYTVRTDGVVDGSCPAFASALDGTVAMDDGSTWARTEQGCFTVQDDHFRGEGTFVLGAPDGSTVTGTFLSVADLPTDGVPYGLDVTGGTGAYAGVTGRCTVTVAIDGGPLQQTQTGELTCTLVVPAPASASSGGASATVPEAA